MDGPDTEIVTITLKDGWRIVRLESLGITVAVHNDDVVRVRGASYIPYQGSRQDQPILMREDF